MNDLQQLRQNFFSSPGLHCAEALGCANLLMSNQQIVVGGTDINLQCLCRHDCFPDSYKDPLGGDSTLYVLGVARFRVCELQVKFLADILNFSSIESLITNFSAFLARLIISLVTLPSIACYLQAVTGDTNVLESFEPLFFDQYGMATLIMVIP